MGKGKGKRNSGKNAKPSEDLHSQARGATAPADKGNSAAQPSVTAASSIALDGTDGAASEAATSANKGDAAIASESAAAQAVTPPPAEGSADTAAAPEEEVAGAALQTDGADRRAEPEQVEVLPPQADAVGDVPELQPEVQAEVPMPAANLGPSADAIDQACEDLAPRQQDAAASADASHPELSHAASSPAEATIPAVNMEMARDAVDQACEDLASQQEATTAAAPPVDEARHDALALETRSLLVQPGVLGLTILDSSGTVDRVDHGSQCEKLGVHAGCRLLTVNGMAYSQEVLTSHADGDSPYFLAFSGNGTPQEFLLTPRTWPTQAEGVWKQRTASRSHQALLWLQPDGKWFHRAYREMPGSEITVGPAWELAECLGTWLQANALDGQPGDLVELTIKFTRWTSNCEPSLLLLRPTPKDQEDIDLMSELEELRVQFSVAVGGKTLMRVPDIASKLGLLNQDDKKAASEDIATPYILEKRKEALTLRAVKALGLEPCYRRGDRAELSSEVPAAETSHAAHPNLSEGSEMEMCLIS